MREGEALTLTTVLGDLVGSRDAVDRRGVHRRVREVLSQVNEVVPPVTPLRVTAGDEFQGTYHHLGNGLSAAGMVRLLLMPEIDVRVGLGWGEVTLLDAEQDTQDGPGWWAARAAIEWVESCQTQPPTRRVRTAYRRQEDAAGPDPHGINAALLCRDQMMGSLDERALRILRGMMHNQTQAEIAEAEGISASAVSQRVRRDGLAILVTVASELEAVR